MQRVVGRTFQAAGPGGRGVALKLVEVTDMRPRRRPAPDPGPSILEREGALVAISTLDIDRESIPIGARPFGLLFLGPSRYPLTEDRYDLELPYLSLPGLRLSPLGASQPPQGEGLLYEAVLD